MRRFGCPREAEITYQDRPGAYGIIARDGMLLLTCKSSAGGELQLPGGGIDPGETPLRALHRETFEETGWRIAPVRRLGAYQRFAWLPDYEFHARKICHIYLCRPVRRLGVATDEAHFPVWIAAADAAARTEISGDAAFIVRSIQQGLI